MWPRMKTLLLSLLLLFRQHAKTLIPFEQKILLLLIPSIFDRWLTPDPSLCFACKHVLWLFLLPLFWLIIFTTYKKIVKRTPAPQPPSHLQQQQQTSSSLSSSRNSSSSSLRWPGNSTAAPCWLDLLFFFFLFCVSFCDFSSSAARNGTKKNGLFFFVFYVVQAIKYLHFLSIVN